jgi:catechol 2,3-dioxygenase-like lactoylglutathione lyase family enzyme
MDLKLELVAVPVSDVDAAIAFYTGIGFVLDHDITVCEEMRFVQLTPPGSACSIALGVSEMEPGTMQGLQVVVEDAEATRDHLRANGYDAPDVQDFPWGRFTYFADPDGNGWACQQIVVPEG